MGNLIIGIILGGLGTYCIILTTKPCIHEYKNMTFIGLDENENYVMNVERFCGRCLKKKWQRRLTAEETKTWKEGELNVENIKKKVKNHKG